MSVARIALPIALHQCFDYWIPRGLHAGRGSVVRVSLARRMLSGVVMECLDDSTVERGRLTPIADIAAMPPLPEEVLAVVEFVAAYYQAPLGLALSLALPPDVANRARKLDAQSAPLALNAHGRAELAGRIRGDAARSLFALLEPSDAALDAHARAQLSTYARGLLRKWQRAGWISEIRLQAPHAQLPLNPEQNAASDAICQTNGFAAFLLQGITGSGKTAVYMQAAAHAIAQGGQVLLLVPEINLTPQLESRVRAALPGVRAVALHSGLAAGERRAAWQAAYDGTADLVLGTRLAVFTPLPRLALVIVDEEHDASYKQQDNVRYHARDVAVLRARHRGVPVVLGSATPSLETWAHAHAGRYRLLRLPRRADPLARLPSIGFVADRMARDNEGVSDALLAAIDARLQRHEQSLVFVNRRGFAPSLKCTACGWEAGCPRCSARLTVHRDARQLRCHHCGHAEALRAACPDCGNVDLLPQGFGTQRLERTLATAFPRARIARVDRDTTRTRRSFAAVRDRVEERSIDILVGTQMLAKGHDFPRLTLVGVLGADNALYSADFRATERAAALLLQVAGRAGRAGWPGEVIVQTDFPQHPVYRALEANDYDAFANSLLEERRLAQLPPCAYIALLTAEAHARAEVDRFLTDALAIAQGIARREDHEVEVYPPVPALLARRAGFERSQILLQTARRGNLQRFLAALRPQIEGAGSKRVRWAIDVDPQGF